MTKKKTDDYHRPVLVAEVAKYLISDPNGAYLDLTVGGGGHLRALSLRVEPGARLYGIDRDAEAIAAAQRALRKRPEVHALEKGTFAEVGTIIQTWPDRLFHGILLDLGVSSHQINEASRGFSFQSDGPLDMRMDRSSGESAATLLERLETRELAELIRKYGEERMAKRIAQAIVRERQTAPIRTTGHLARIIRSVVPSAHVVKTLARVFQALRIAVNDELGQLKRVLPAAFDLLLPGGRLAVISYHSLEDRTVKQYFRSLAAPP
ncbi:MAG: 16S rRNA (cytosine(1402)-N(4))-methyltransferase RsmH, partial [Candidatus Zixiibacteriota bacterium]